MFSGGEYEPPETSRPAILPFTLVLIVGLLVGFGGGYWARDRMASPESSTQAPAATQASGAPAGAATSETPGQYSEQKLTPPARTAAMPPSVPPPVPDDTSSASPASAALRGLTISWTSVALSCEWMSLTMRLGLASRMADADGEPTASGGATQPASGSAAAAAVACRNVRRSMSATIPSAR